MGTHKSSFLYLTESRETPTHGSLVVLRWSKKQTGGKPTLQQTQWAPLRELEVSPSPFLESITVQTGAVAEGGVALHGHAQAAVDHAGIAILGAKCLVGHLEARGTVYGAVNPHNLETP